jgi:hypothetical protein
MNKESGNFVNIEFKIMKNHFVVNIHHYSFTV